MSKKIPESTSSDKEQYKLRVGKQLIDRLSRLAARLGYSSGNEFAADALEQYAEFLADLIDEQLTAQTEFRRRQIEEAILKLRIPHKR